MISLFEAIKIASLSYGSENNDYKNYKYVNNSENLVGGSGGYFAKAFINHLQKIIVISHRGTELNPYNHASRNSGVIDNLIEDSSVYCEELPQHISKAIEFRNKLHNEYFGYDFIHIGHSLGGYYAHIIGYKCKDRVIAFDSPGWKECEKDCADFSDVNEKHFTFLAKPNLINTVNTHLGRVFAVRDDVVGMYNSSQLGLNAVRNHGIEEFFSFTLEKENYPIFGSSKAPPRGFVELNDDCIFCDPVLTPQKRSKLAVGYFDCESWMVSIVNIKKNNYSFSSLSDGHIVIVVEGIKLIEGETDKYKLFIGQYDLVVREGQKGLIVMIRCFENSNYRKDYSQYKAKSQLLDAINVVKMIEEIKKEEMISEEKCKHEESLYPYSLLGNSFPFISDDCAENCVSWAKKKLKIAGWTKPLGIIDHPAKPVKPMCVIC